FPRLSNCRTCYPFIRARQAAADPASYRPVCILPALSKILETVVKTDFEIHLAKTEALPNTQFGFQEGPLDHNCVGHCPCKVVESRAEREGCRGPIGFDLSAAFDTVDQLQLLPKLKKLGIEGMQLSGSSHTSLADHSVWCGMAPIWCEARFLLGPILYLVLVADVTSCVGIGDEENSSYADDFFLWAVGDSLEEVGLLLETKADAFSKYAGGNGLVLNAAKTQFMIGGKAKKKDTSAFTSGLGASSCTHPMRLSSLGSIRLRLHHRTAPHNAYVVKAAKQRAALISRLAVHIPRGKYLRQLARGLMVGKLSYAAANKGRCRTQGRPFAINDVARSIAGCRRRDPHSDRGSP
ncbi:Uncharacterized protein FKW44_019028, partial [Caligus rogercresseyi]